MPPTKRKDCTLRVSSIICKSSVVTVSSDGGWGIDGTNKMSGGVFTLHHVNSHVYPTHSLSITFTHQQHSYVVLYDDGKRCDGLPRHLIVVMEMVICLLT
jgi:hypothetical protein